MGWVYRSVLGSVEVHQALFEDLSSACLVGCRVRRLMSRRAMASIVPIVLAVFPCTVLKHASQDIVQLGGCTPRGCGSEAPSVAQCLPTFVLACVLLTVACCLCASWHFSVILCCRMHFRSLLPPAHCCFGMLVAYCCCFA